VPGEGGVRFEALPPPTQGEVERLLKGVRHRVLRLLEKRGALPAQGPEDALQAYPAHSLQQRLRWTEVDVRPPPNKQPRCALLEGFCLHANTHLHANDRQGLERRCRYGARGALALARLSRASGRPHRLSDEATAAGRHPAPALHRVGVAASPGVPDAWCLGQTSRGSTASSLQAPNCGHFGSLKQVRRRRARGLRQQPARSG